MKNIYLFFFINIIFLSLVKISYSRELPEWILNPVAEGYRVCATGLALNNNNKALQKKIARINAMAELSKINEVKVSNQLDIEKNITTYNGKVLDSSKNISSQSRQSSNTIIDNTEEVADFYDEKEGIYYILLCTK